MEERSAAKSGEVDGHGSVVLREAFTDANPVVGTATKAVDHQKRLPIPAEVKELDRPIQVYSPMPHCVNLTPKLASTCPASPAVG